MKKIKLLFLGIFCLIITGCGNNEMKEASNLDNFSTISENNQFIVVDNMSTYSGVSYIKGAKVATLDDVNIEMFIYDNEDNAIKVQDKQIDGFMNLRNAGAAITKDKGGNYYKYTMISNGYYMVSSRIQNTLVFSKTPIANKEKVETILNEIGY